jgi:hypothetical protein
MPSATEGETAEGETVQAQRRHSTVVWHRVVRALVYLLAWIFLVLVLVGNVSNKPVLRDTYFLKLDLSNIIPESVPNAVFINSIARTIGLHDFYQVGVWNFCEGYDDSGITSCSHPQTLYWFDPVSILLNELLSGATIALPSDIDNALDIAKIASHWMFALFLVGTILCFLAIFIAPLGTSSRPPQTISSDTHTNDVLHPHHRPKFIFLWSLPMVLFTFIIALFTIVASAVATVMYVIFAHVFTSSAIDLNVKAYLGKRMLAFMWIASAFTLIGFIIQLASCCCACCGGRKARKALQNQSGSQEKNSNGQNSDGANVKRRFGWRKNRVEA